MAANRLAKHTVPVPSPSSAVGMRNRIRRPMDYIRRIRDLREDRDKTQWEIAQVLGTSQTMYARYERGANELPIRHLITLCRYYHVSADYILGLDEGKQSR